jgi:hypothetical protein
LNEFFTNILIPLDFAKISFIYEKTKLDFYATIPVEIETITGFIQENFQDLIVQDYILQYKDSPISLIYLNHILQTTKHIDLMVTNKCVSFADFSEESSLKYANVPYRIKDDSQFIDADINIYSSEIKELFTHTVNSIMNVKMLFGDITEHSICAIREYISPILILSGLLFKDMNLNIKSDKYIVGTLGKGKLDYTYMYKQFDLPITIHYNIK